MDVRDSTNVLSLQKYIVGPISRSPLSGTLSDAGSFAPHKCRCTSTHEWTARLSPRPTVLSAPRVATTLIDGTFLGKKSLPHSHVIWNLVPRTFLPAGNPSDKCGQRSCACGPTLVGSVFIIIRRHTQVFNFRACMRFLIVHEQNLSRPRGGRLLCAAAFLQN